MFRMNVRLVASTLALVLAVASSSWSVAAAGSGQPPAERLTLENFNKLMKAEQALAGTPRDPNLERAMAMHGDPDPIRRWAVQLESDKKTSAALKSAGLTAQEYTRTLVAVLQAYGLSGLKKQNKAVPDSLVAQVPAENLAFVEKHAAEIESWGRHEGKQVKPNTMEDTYVEQATPAADPQTAVADSTSSKPAASGSQAAKKTKDGKPAAKAPGTDKP